VIDSELLGGDEFLDVIIERADVLNQVFRPFFKSQEDTRLVVFDRAIVEEGHGEQGLAAACGPAEEGRPAPRETPLGHVIEPRNIAAIQRARVLQSSIAISKFRVDG
jgi:hypothetical protein